MLEDKKAAPLLTTEKSEAEIAALRKRVRELKMEMDKIKDKNGNILLQFETSNPFAPESKATWTSTAILEENLEEYEAPEWCVPIHANILEFDFKVVGYLTF